MRATSVLGHGAVPLPKTRAMAAMAAMATGSTGVLVGCLESLEAMVPGQSSRPDHPFEPQAASA